MTYLNSTNQTVSLQYIIDTGYYASPPTITSGDALRKTVDINPNCLFYFDETEDNGAEIIALCNPLLSLVT